MFNIGQRAQNNPALVQAQLDAGLWIGNHTFTHPHLPTLTAAQVQSQLQQTQNGPSSRSSLTWVRPRTSPC